MDVSKVELRKTLLARRLAMPLEERQTKTVEITEMLKQVLEWNNTHKVHVFESIEKLAEIDTRPFIDYIKQNYPELKIYHSKKFNNIWQDFDESGALAGDIVYDAIIVPLLGFDDSLNRVGYGGGHYDRFLSLQRGAKTIGLGFETGHIPSIPVLPHDIPLKYIVSEKQIYSKY